MRSPTRAPRPAPPDLPGLTAPLLTAEEVAELLQVSPFTVKQLVKRKQLRGRIIGRAYRIQRSSVDEYMRMSDKATPVSPS